MIKNNKWKLLISSVIILLPMIAGLILWDVLPEKMATHWGVGGKADGFSSRPFAVFGLPAFMLLIHWICVFFTAADRKNRQQNKKVFGMIFWICPIMSVLSGAIIYASAFGIKFNMDVIMLIAIGLMFTIIGNYLPKCKQNHTIGIKVPWALNDEENWNATHRFCGKVWVIGGLLLMAAAFLPQAVIPYVLLIILIPLAVLPVLYSYLYYKKQKKQ